jgi:hypothetical protein
VRTRRLQSRMSIASTDITVDAAHAEVEAGAVRAYLSSCRWTLTAVALTVVGVFLPTVIVPYAFSDDYTDLYMATGWGGTAQFGRNIIDVSAITGRPFSGLLIQWFFAAAGAIENLRFVRLVAVLTIVALALLGHWTLVRSGVKRVPAALIAVILCTLPPFQVYASWAVLFSSPLAAFLAGCGSLFAVSAVRGRPELARDRYLGAVFLVLAALLIYQPAAMFFWVFFAIAMVGSATDPIRSLGVVKAHFGVGFVALALAYLEIKITVAIMGSSTTGAGRNTLSHDVVGKTRWLVHQPLYRALNIFDITPTHWFAGLVAVVAALGIVLWLVRWGARPLLYIGVGLVLIPLTYLPNLIVTDMWPAYRTQVAIDALVALYASLGAMGLWLTFAEWLKPRASAQALVSARHAAVALSVALTATCVVAAAHNVTTLFVLPHSAEQRLLRSQVAALPTGASPIAFVQTDWNGGVAKTVAYDEFGLPSSTRQWTLEPAVDLILHEEGRLEKTGPRPAVEIYPSYVTTLPKGEPVIDLRGMAKLR